MKRITVAELNWLLERGAVDLVDVRPAGEFRRVHVDGARSVPLSKLEPHSFTTKGGQKRSPPVCLICDRTLRASLAAGLLSGAGAADVRLLEGGLRTWMKEGLPVIEHPPSQRLSRFLTYLGDFVASTLTLLRQRRHLHPA